jgi:hypothetical protein
VSVCGFALLSGEGRDTARGVLPSVSVCGFALPFGEGRDTARGLIARESPSPPVFISKNVAEAVPKH